MILSPGIVPSVPFRRDLPYLYSGEGFIFIVLKTCLSPGDPLHAHSSTYTVLQSSSVFFCRSGKDGVLRRPAYCVSYCTASVGSALWAVGRILHGVNLNVNPFYK